MKYSETGANENYSVKRYQSENKKWEFGWRMMMYGLRFSANPVGSQGYSIDYCAGANKLFITFLNLAMLGIFDNLSEDISEKELTNILPKDSDIKPIYKDAAWQMINLQLKSLNVHSDYKQLNYYAVSSNLKSGIANFRLFSNESQKIGVATANKTNSWLIKEFYIKPEYRNAGLGTYLLQYICQYFWHKSYIPVVLESYLFLDDSLKHWCSAMGFNLTNGLYIRKGGDYNYGFLRRLQNLE